MYEQSQPVCAGKPVCIKILRKTKDKNLFPVFVFPKNKKVPMPEICCKQQKRPKTTADTASNSRMLRHRFPSKSV